MWVLRIVIVSISVHDVTKLEAILFGRRSKVLITTIVKRKTWISTKVSGKLNRPVPHLEFTLKDPHGIKE